MGHIPGSPNGQVGLSLAHLIQSLFSGFGFAHSKYIAKLNSNFNSTTTSTGVENSIYFVLVDPSTHHPPGLVVTSFNFNSKFNYNF